MIFDLDSWHAGLSDCVLVDLKGQSARLLDEKSTFFWLLMHVINRG